jgi:hypothetical protein
MTFFEVIQVGASLMSTTSSTKIQRYSQELSAYTLRQFCLASALLDHDKDAGSMPHLSAAHRRVAGQANRVRLFFELGYHFFYLNGYHRS